MSAFRTKLAELINYESMENESNTPDFILAEYMADCLEAFDKAVNRRTDWYTPEIEDNQPEGEPPQENNL